DEDRDLDQRPGVAQLLDRLLRTGQVVPGLDEDHVRRLAAELFKIQAAEVEPAQRHARTELRDEGRHRRGFTYRALRIRTDHYGAHIASDPSPACRVKSRCLRCHGLDLLPGAWNM